MANSLQCGPPPCRHREECPMDHCATVTPEVRCTYYEAEQRLDMNPVCPYCKSRKTTRHLTGAQTAYPVKRWHCTDCGKWMTI